MTDIEPPSETPYAKTEPDAPERRDASRRRRLRRLSAVLIGVAISAGFLLLLFRQLDLKQVWDEALQVNLAVLALALVTQFFGFVMMSARVGVLMRPLTRYRPMRLFKAVLAGFAGNNVLPLRMGELLRIDYLARHGDIPHSACLAVIGVERLLDISCLVLLASLLLPVILGTVNLTALISVAGTVLAGFTVFFFIARDRLRFARWCRALSGWMGARLARFVTDKAMIFADGLASLSSRSTFMLGVVTSWGYWATSLLSMGISLRAFSMDLPWYGPGVVLVFIAFGVVLPSTPAFVGTYHYFAKLALSLFGISAARAAAFALVAHAFGFIPYTVLAIGLLLGEILRGDLRASQLGA